MVNIQQTELFDLTTNNKETGFRLERLEVYNWGTFNQHVWHIEPQRENALLTGDIGSGKSTLVDAITTLLVPHHRITYNKAAGAESKERNLYSYIRGEYKNEKDDFTQSAKAISLRGENSYTVLLGYFYSAGFSQGVTLAQVFWLKDNKRNPEKLFIITQKPLTITKHFSGFGSDILKLKNQLRHDNQIELFDNFTKYSASFRKLFGIHNEQALELFYQTVSMKSVGNLTEFVRNHMLEKCDIDSRIQELRHNFDNLSRAHEAILKAKHQITLLKPLADDALLYENLGTTISQLDTCRASLHPYFASQKAELLNKCIVQLEVEIERDQEKIIQYKKDKQELATQEGQIKKSIDDNGGQQLQAIEQEIERLTLEREQKQKTATHYLSLAEKLNLNKNLSEDSFAHNAKLAHTLLEEINVLEKDLQIKQVNVQIEIKAIESQQSEISNELISLKSRKNNIPTSMLTLRKNMASVLNLDESELPFVGELLQVLESEKEWEGSIERVLHGFGLSILVLEEHYSQVNHYVERTQLKGKLIYYRINPEKIPTQATQTDKNSLISKLQIKSENIFSSWLENELTHRFNYICCKNLDDFRRLPIAMTPNGLIKSKGQRHEKDDRYALNDRSRYILGWSNQQKIDVLSNKLEQLNKHGQQLVDQLIQFVDQQNNERKKHDICRDLLAVQHYSDINWQPLAQKAQTLIEKKQQIEKSSDILKTLKNQLEEIQQQLHKKSEEQDLLQRKIGGKEEQLENHKKSLKLANDDKNDFIEPNIRTTLEEYQKIILTKLNITIITLNNIEKCLHHTREYLQKELNEQEKKHKNLISSITRQMQSYKHHYPAETTEVDTTPEAAKDYIQMLSVLENADLPRHENRFKELLNQGTINSIALFQNQLNKEKQDIENRIIAINLSLHDIEYSTGTYIKLLIDNTQDIEIRDFQQDLRRCLQNTLSDRNFYDEDKFLQVKKLIERFNGREGLADLDKRWTQKVCDVRNWFNFSASERWIEDDSEKEFYSDSSGKSGGQKEKLAYTILASALAYQFGLKWGETQSRSFRFVVIDEAFGKGSNDSTRYALELFKRLNLQLLIVTPLQKIHVIEDYVSSIHYIENQNGCNSVIRNLTIKEYHAEKHKFNKETHDLTSAN